MAWKTVPGLNGRVYVPDGTDTPKKHACKDCFSCQMCSDERCRVCREAGITQASCACRKPAENGR